MSIIQEQPAQTKANPGQGEGNLLAIVPAALTAAGHSAETIEQARRTIATGYVWGEWTHQVHVQNNTELIPIAEINSAVIDYTLGGKSLQPFLDLIEKERATDTQAEPGHYPFCSGQCVLQRCDDGTTYFEHVSPTVEATIDDPRGGTIRLNAELASDENLVDDRPAVFMRSGTDDGLMFYGPQLDQAIDDLDAFVDGLRRLRKQMDQGRAK